MAKPVNYDNGFFNDGRQYFERGLPAWRQFVLNDLKATSLADFGCGQGDWLEPLQQDIPVWGCDGYADLNHLRVNSANFRHLDIGTVKPGNLDVGPRDVVMSLEAMEHVVHAKEKNFLDCLLVPNPRLIVLGVASGHGTYDPTQYKVNRLGEVIPGGPDWKIQWGRHHVNCQPVDVVIAKMAVRGYIVDQELSDKFSELKVPGKTGRLRYAFASFYRKNTRVYKKATLMINILFVVSIIIMIPSIMIMIYFLGAAVERNRQDKIRREAVADARLANMMQLMDIGSSKDLLEVIHKCQKFVDLIETNPDKLTKLESFSIPNYK